VAEDTDGDKLLFTLWFRGEEESAWKLLQKDIPEQSVTLEADSLAEGKYLFRVEATDSPNNPAAQARSGNLISSPILLDNTAPQLNVTASRSGTTIDISLTATDAASTIRRAEVSVNAGPWQPLVPEDGVPDSKTEKFTLRLENQPAGELQLTFRAIDQGGNVALVKRLL